MKLMTRLLEVRRWLQQLFGYRSPQELYAAVLDPTHPHRAQAVARLGWPDNLEIQATILEATHDADPAVHDMAMLTLLARPQPRPHYIQRVIDSAGSPRKPADPDQVFSSLQEHIDLLLERNVYPADSERYSYTWEAFRALGARAVPGLLHYFEPGVSDESAPTALDYRIEVAQILGYLGQTAAVPELIRALDTTTQNVRHAVVETLGQLGDQQAVAALIPLLQAPDPDLRAVAATSLGQLGDAQALPALQQMAQYDAGCSRQRGRLKEIATKAITQIQN